MRKSHVHRTRVGPQTYLLIITILITIGVSDTGDIHPIGDIPPIEVLPPNHIIYVSIHHYNQPRGTPPLLLLLNSPSIHPYVTICTPFTPLVWGVGLIIMAI